METLTDRDKGRNFSPLLELDSSCSKQHNRAAANLLLFYSKPSFSSSLPVSWLIVTAAKLLANSGNASLRSLYRLVR